MRLSNLIGKTGMETRLLQRENLCCIYKEAYRARVYDRNQDHRHLRIRRFTWLGELLRWATPQLGFISATFDKALAPHSCAN